jgi:hypothetical protein
VHLGRGESVPRALSYHVTLPLGDALLEQVRAGRIDLAPVVGPSFPLELVNDAVEASLAGEPGRVLVTLAA